MKDFNPINKPSLKQNDENFEPDAACSTLERSGKSYENFSSGNDAVKMDMAEDLLAQGVSEEAVCRLLHINEELLLDND